MSSLRKPCTDAKLVCDIVYCLHIQLWILTPVAVFSIDIVSQGHIHNGVLD
eukprot:XP_001709354.1 Hypothetical protein GL50803_35910 [Giardia lamblia ATCC 50803]